MRKETHGNGSGDVVSAGSDEAYPAHVREVARDWLTVQFAEEERPERKGIRSRRWRWRCVVGHGTTSSIRAEQGPDGGCRQAVDTRDNTHIARTLAPTGV